MQFAVVYQVSGLIYSVKKPFEKRDNALQEVARVRKEEKPDIIWIIVFQNDEISQVQKQPSMN